jgi:nucleoside-diphosphate-sugar epimerase
VKVLVTGGAGFIGSGLVRALLRDGHEVRVVDNFSTGYRHNLDAVAADVQLVEGDLTSYERAHAAVKGVEVVYHLAALPSVPRSVQDPLTTNAVNVNGTLNVLLCARDQGVRRVVYSSSSSVYGNAPTLPKSETTLPQPLAPYAVAKLAGEHYCRAFSQVYELETVSLRYFNVFGPRQDPNSQYSAVIPKFISSMLRDETLYVHGDGEQTRDFTFVDNVVDANILASQAPASDVAGLALNIACGRRVSVNELIAEIAAVLGREAHVTYDDHRPGDVLDSLADISLAGQVLGYRPSVDLRTGLAQTVRWLAEHEDRREAR